MKSNTPGHNYRSKQLFSILMEEDSDEQEPNSGELSIICDEPMEDIVTHEVEPELSIHSISSTEGMILSA